MKLKKLLKDLPIKIALGSHLVEITGICSDSRRVVPGNLFVARKGSQSHGSKFSHEVVKAGAAAILTDLPDPFLEGVTQLYHPKPEEVEAALSANYYEHISEQLLLVGVTGTNGKTTTAYLTRFLLGKLAQPCGLIGTIEWLIGNKIYPSVNTTPDIHTTYKLLYEMRQEGCSAAVMEVSSHALDQNRVKGLDFDIALFTNLSQDHLDYHLTMEKYGAAKAQLFSSLSQGKNGKKGKFPKCAIINNDSDYAAKIRKVTKVDILTYGIETESDLMAKEIELGIKGSSFIVTYKNTSARFFLPLVGRFNISNALGVTGVGLTLGYSLERIAGILRDFPGLSGRMERVESGEAQTVYIDYAHTPDALEKVLKTLKEFCKGKVIVVFGCGGARDREKRPQMGLIASKYADFSLITSDNPRTEEPELIADEIVAGFENSNYLVELDRATAIKKAIERAQPDDCVLIAGKGHEKVQIFAQKTVPFDDKQVAKECCAALQK